jgi:hypothetical protein
VARFGVKVWVPVLNSFEQGPDHVSNCIFTFGSFGHEAIELFQGGVVFQAEAKVDGFAFAGVAL